jgi:hypothetical protein
VILLENSNEWNLSPAKEGSLKRESERSKDWKAKEVKPHLKTSMFLKKGGWDLHVAGRDSIKRKK